MNPFGPFGNMMPYSNFHGMNLDWVIQISKDFLDQYTHIQETIAEGEEQLEQKATELEQLLQQWYDTHSEDIAAQLAAALLEISTTINSEFQTKLTAFNTAADTKAAAVLESIPADYTQLSDTVTKNIPRAFICTDPYVAINEAIGLGETIIANFDNCTDATKSIILYGYYVNESDQTVSVPLATLDANTRRVKIVTNRTYTKLQLSISPYSATWEGTFSVYLIHGYYTGMDNRMYSIESELMHKYTGTTPTMNMFYTGNVGDTVYFEIDNISTPSVTGLTLYGRNSSNNYVVITTVREIHKFVKVTLAANYSAFRIGISPYNGSWEGSYSFFFCCVPAVKTIGNVYDAIIGLQQPISSIVNTVPVYMTSTEPISAMASQVSQGETIIFTYNNCSDPDKRLTLYGVYTTEGQTHYDTLTTTDSITSQRAVVAERDYNSLQVAIAPYDASWTGTFSYFIIHSFNRNLESEIYSVTSEIMNKISFENVPYLNLITPGTTGSIIFFTVNNITDPDISALTLYGYRSGQFEVLMRTGQKHVINKLILAHDYDYFRVAISPYASTWEGSASFFFACLSDIKGIGEVYNNIFNIQENFSFKHNGTTAKIFKKVVCCGDSYTSGHIQLSGGSAYGTNFEFAWPHYMETATGNSWINCGFSGANVWTWMERAEGLQKAQQAGPVQAYNIGLMINDQSDSERGVPLGTVDDIGTENHTYYAGMSKLIRELNTISPTAKIFVDTCPQDGEQFPQYNQAVKDIVEAYENTYPVYLLDLHEHKDMYNVASLTSDRVNGHYTAIGYEQFAEIMMTIMSNYINTHITDFQDVFEIPYNS